MTFEELGLNKNTIKALKDDGIEEPTKIQNLTIPLVKAGRDVIAISHTGSGKTAAFGAPIIEKIKAGEGLQALILTPTRELAVQIEKELEKFSKYDKLGITTVYGGVSLDPQAHVMERSEIVVATTGRFLDHMRRGNVDLSQINTIVLDEADKMVEMGFIEDVEIILGQCPKNRQILLFGATISDEVKHLQTKYMNDPAVERAEMHVKDDFLEQYYYDVKPNEKFSLLVHLIKNEDTDRIIIFCATRASAEILTKNLKSHGIGVEMIHGKLGQGTRMKIMEKFKEGKPKILVASAVAARGLHIDHVSHIINYSMSNDPQEYIHRVGRTARAGESGKAITLLEPRDHDAFSNVLRQYDIKVEKLEKMPFERLAFKARDYNSDRRSGFGGRSKPQWGQRRSGGPSRRPSFKGRRDSGNRRTGGGTTTTARGPIRGGPRPHGQKRGPGRGPKPKVQVRE